VGSVQTADGPRLFALDASTPYGGVQSQRITSLRGLVVGVENRGLNRWGELQRGQAYDATCTRAATARLRSASQRRARGDVCEHDRGR